jgi:starch synthase
LVEDYLDNLGLSLDQFRDEMTGGWMFGFIEALKRAGCDPVLICVSARVSSVTRTTHRATGAPLCFLPAPRVYRAIRRTILNPYAATVEEAVGAVRGARWAFCAVLKELAPHLATPLRALARELRRIRCSAVLCQEYEHPRFDACVRLGRRLRLPVFGVFEGGGEPLTRLERLFRRWSISHCAGLVIAARSEAQRVRARYGVPESRIARVFNPVDLSQCQAGERTAARAELGIPAGARVVAWHGRVLLPFKGLDVLVTAWDRLRRERPGRELCLLLIGTGGSAGELGERLDAVGRAGVVWVNQFLNDRERLYRHLSAADVYTLPSRHEGPTVAPIEAMALGLPVVASGVGGIPDILEGGEQSGGVVVPPGDPAALSHALGRLLDDEVLARRLGERAAFRAQSAFSLEAVGGQLADFLTARGAIPPRQASSWKDGGRTRLGPQGGHSGGPGGH